MIYDNLLSEKLNEKQLLLKQTQTEEIKNKLIKLDNEILELQKLSNPFFAEIIEIPEISKFVSQIFEQEEFINMTNEDIVEILNKHVCEVHYKKANGSIRVFKEASLHISFLNEFFKDKNTNGNNKGNSNNLGLVEIDENGQYQYKNIIKNNLISIVTLKEI